MHVCNADMTIYEYYVGVEKLFLNKDYCIIVLFSVQPWTKSKNWIIITTLHVEK